MESEDKFVERLAKRHSFSTTAVQAVLVALRRGGGRMAQFSHADFGGMSQWSPGMSMVGDMFNTQLKSRLDALCADIVAYLTASEVVGSDVSSKPEEVSYRSETRPPAWWPIGLGHPAAVGGQNDLRYAIFSETRRLVIDDRGTVSTYDTGDHQIFGVAQVQSGERTLSFTSQSGLVKVTDLTKV
jgi:hypothetical protein